MLGDGASHNGPLTKTANDRCDHLQARSFDHRYRQELESRTAESYTAANKQIIEKGRIAENIHFKLV